MTPDPDQIDFAACPNGDDDSLAFALPDMTDDNNSDFGPLDTALQRDRRAGQDMHAVFAHYSDTKVIEITRRQLWWRAFAIGLVCGLAVAAVAFAGACASFVPRSATIAPAANTAVVKRGPTHCFSCGAWVAWGKPCKNCERLRAERGSR